MSYLCLLTVVNEKPRKIHKLYKDGEEHLFLLDCLILARYKLNHHRTRDVNRLEISSFEDFELVESGGYPRKIVEDEERGAWGE